MFVPDYRYAHAVVTVAVVVVMVASRGTGYTGCRGKARGGFFFVWQIDSFLASLYLDALARSLLERCRPLSTAKDHLQQYYLVLYIAYYFHSSAGIFQYLSFTRAIVRVTKYVSYVQATYLLLLEVHRLCC